MIPVEFARKSSNGRVTLVLGGTHESQTFWAKSALEEIDEACENLWVREGKPRRRSIHYTSGDGLQTWNGGIPEPGSLDVSYAVCEWIGTTPDADCAIWTGLPPKDFDIGAIDLAHQVVEHLQGLEEPAMRLAKEYIELAPETVRTPVRSAIEEKLGWVPRPLPANLFDESP